MKNAKLQILLKELPWLSDLDPLVAQAVSVSVERLDIDLMLTMNVGRIRGVEYPSDSRGYFVDENGVKIGNVHEMETAKNKLLGCLRRAVALIKFDHEVSEVRTISEAVADITNRNPIRFVVVVRQMYYSKEFIELKVFKLPRSKTMNDLLEDIRVTNDKKWLAEEQETKAKINSVLSS